MLRQTDRECVPAAELREVCADLERRLVAGQACSAEVMFTEHPDLCSDAEAALEVIYTEFVAREQLGQRPHAAEFLKRFPQWKRELQQLFEIHQFGDVGSEVFAAPSSSTSFPDASRLQKLVAPSADGAARRIGNYELLGEIGRGGMGVVYKARQIGLNRLVALKMILSGVDAGPQERARFRAEAKAAARLQHPNIVQIHEVGEHDGRPFLCLEYVDGGNLENLLSGNAWQAAEAARLIETLARAMHYAHQQGVVHRDLKPANVLLQLADCRLQIEATEKTALAKVTDFGLARQLPDGDTGAAARTGPTKSGAIVGTPAYMAPEQAAGDGRAIGPAADVHALGAILYELLTGRPPYMGVNVLETLELVRARDPLPPSRLAPALPRDLETICLKCLEKEPGRRYASAMALADDLGRFQRGEPILARPTPAWEKAWKWARRRPAVAALLVSLVGLTIVAMSSVTVLWRQTATALVAMQKERDDKEAALASKLVALAERDWLANDLDAARRHLDECPPAHRGPAWRYLHRVSHACLFVLGDPDPHEKISFLAWSPDGRHLASTSFHYGSKVWDPETGRLRFALPLQTPAKTRLVPGANSDLISLHFSTHKAADRNGRLITKTLDFATRREIRRFMAPVFMYGHALSGDCRRLAVIGEKENTIIDLDNGATLASIPHRFQVAVFSAALNADGRLLAWSEAQAVRVWDTATAAPAGPALPLRGEHLAFSPDGASLAVCRNERDQFRSGAEIWDYRAGRELIKLHGHTSPVLWAAFSPDGRRLATASADTTVKVWDVATGRERFTFRGHRAAVSGVEFSPDGTRLASGSQDGTVRIWDVRPGDERPD